MHVALVFFPGCPHVVAARTQLTRAFEALGEAPRWVELDVTKGEAALWGSPTVLVDGRDVEGQSPGDATACRLYPGSEVPGAPALATLIAALRQSRG